MSATLFLGVWVVLFEFLGLIPAPQETKDPVAEIPKRLEMRYGAARTLEVKFLERYAENGRFVRAEAGTAYFLRPGKMRWDYESPEKSTFLVDGKFVWFYSPADRTATRMPAKQSEDWRTPLAFLTSHMKLSRLCARFEEEKGATAAQSGDSVFGCDLRAEDSGKGSGTDRQRPGSLRDSGQAEGGPYNSGGNKGTRHKPVLFEVSPEGELKRIVVREEAGMELELSFTGWEWDPPLDKSLFEFVPPKGVAIVEGLLPETPGLRQ
jgi:outer membrane lipoprotein-sorting protein